MNPMAITENTARNVGADGSPGLPIISGLVKVWIPVIHLMKINRQISFAFAMFGWLDIRDSSPGGKIGDVFGDVGPSLTTITGKVDQSIIGAYPNYSWWLNRG